MPGALQAALQINRPVAERLRGLLLRAGEGGGQIGLAVHPRHADATAAGDGLQHHRKAEFVGAGLERFHVGNGVGSTMHRESRRGHVLSCAGFLAHRFQPVDARPDEADARGRDGAREARVFGEEAVAGVQRVRAGGLGGGDQPFGVEIGVRRPIAGKPHGLGGRRQMRRVGIRVRVGSDALNAQRRASPRHAGGHRAPVGNEHACEHGF